MWFEGERPTDSGGTVYVKPPDGQCTDARTDELHVELHTHGGGTVRVGDHDITAAVQHVQITGGPSGSRAVLDLHVPVTLVEGSPAVTLPPHTVAALEHLGWTPPADRPACGHWVPGAPGEGGEVIPTPRRDCRMCATWAEKDTPPG